MINTKLKFLLCQSFPIPRFNEAWLAAHAQLELACHILVVIPERVRMRHHVADLACHVGPNVIYVGGPGPCSEKGFFLIMDAHTELSYHFQEVVPHLAQVRLGEGGEILQVYIGIRSYHNFVLISEHAHK